MQGTGPDEEGRPRKDSATVAYFDEHLPDYSIERLEYAATVINQLKSKNASLVDVGCGNGLPLNFLRERTGITDIWGIDVSEKSLERARERVACQTAAGSILDRDFVRSVERQFDFAVLAALLHHLIGRTRRDSRRLAILALSNSLKLVKPGGYLILLEPVFYPRLAMDMIFYAKKAMSKLTRERVPIFGKWNNIGPPVVSYYTNEDLQKMVSEAGARVRAIDIQDRPLGWPGVLLRRANTTLVTEKSV